MPDPAADPRSPRTPKALAGLAGLACLACCLLPVLITAGVVGAGASAVVGWLPALSVALAALAGATRLFGRRRPSCSCRSAATSEHGCGCKADNDPPEITGPVRR
ncbi:hypothetical protein [Streptomyces herbicida]|uniref:hypothetical protein n=1 Tax=Streptomyces herbicida TaxID=3065675 RepID=UPI002930702B|nr:hypothetical protein [Streptomyces sp. NEAU-HV9]